MNLNIKTNTKRVTTAREDREREAQLLINFLRDVIEKQKDIIKEKDKIINDKDIIIKILENKNKRFTNYDEYKSEKNLQRLKREISQK